MDGATVQLFNSDPPYNVAVEPRSNNAIAAGFSSFPSGKAAHLGDFDRARYPGKGKATNTQMRAKDRPLDNDALSDADFAVQLRRWFGQAARVLDPGRAFYIWGGYANVKNYPSALEECGLFFHQALIWVKRHPVMGRKDFMGDHEWCFYGWREGAGHVWLGPNNAVDVWEVKKLNHTEMVHLCLHPDASVLTDAGYRPIRSLAVGDRVLAGDGQFHGVEHVSSHRYTSEHLYRIKARGGSEVTDASDNHPFLIWRPKRKGASIVGSEIVWLRADQLEVGDYTMTPILAESGADPLPEMTEEDCFMLGLYLAQGHIQATGHGDGCYPVFSIHKKRTDLRERIAKNWRSTSEYDPNDYNDIKSQGLTVMAFDAAAGKRFEALGGRLSHAKRIAPAVFQMPREKRMAVLQGWLNGDGCRVHDRTYWQGNTVSADLAAHLCLLAESVGYRTNAYCCDPPAELGGIGSRKFKSQRRVHSLYFYDRYQQAKRGATVRVQYDSREYSLRKIKSVERVPYTGDVWNLSVEGCPSFQTAVGLSHNTQKPGELAARAMTYSTRPGERVLDLFGGSGWTICAAEQMDRIGYSVELDPLYCDVIVARWEQLTGKKADRQKE